MNPIFQTSYQTGEMVTLCISCGMPIEPYALRCSHCHPEPPIEEAELASGYHLSSTSIFHNVLILLVIIFNFLIFLAIIFVIGLAITFVIVFFLKLFKPVRVW
jgi:hypothetical protein